MPQVACAALVLQTFPYSDTSKILRLLTREHGLQSVIAKGALRPRSRFGGVLEAFTEGHVTFYLREMRDLHTLAGFELIRSRQTLGADLIRFGGASLVAELVLRVASEENDPDLFDAVRDALNEIEQAPQAQLESTVLAVTWSIVTRLGFGPVLDECIHCGNAISDQDEVLFDYATGGVYCLNCSSGQGGRLVPAAARAALRALTRGVVVDLTRTGAHWRLLDRFLSHHVLEGQSLQSLAFLAESVGQE